MIKIFYTALLIFAFLLTACVKEKDYFIPDGTFEFVGDVHALRQNLKPDVIYASFELPAEETLIPISDIVHLVLEEGSLLDINNDVYTGQVDVELRTAASISEWAGWDFSMVTEDGFLDALASQKIKFIAADNSLLKINAENPPVLRWVSMDEDKQLAVFQKDEKFNKWKFLSSEVEYNERQILVNNQAEISAAYEFTLTGDGWFTLGVELLKPHGSDICVNHSEGFTKANTISFVIFKNYNTIVILNDWDSENPYKNCNNLLRLPINEDVKVVSIAGISGNRYFFNHLSLNLSSSEFDIEMEPKKSNLNKILQLLNN